MEKLGRRIVGQFVVLLVCLLFPMTLYASFIEATIGAAVVNDATAIFYNPAALVVLKKPQFITLNTLGRLHSEFSGQAVQVNTNFVLTGSSLTQTKYYLPSLYFGLPLTKKIAVGVALISNFFNRDLEGGSILRYAQSNNSVKDFDVIPAIGYKFNDVFSLGAAVNFSHANFLLRPTSGFPSIGIPDSQSRNQADGNGVGGDLGCLLKLGKSTLVGLNYRSSITYRLNGTSIFEGTTRVVSDHYGFTFWTPARSVLSVNQSITKSLGVIATVQRIYWSIFKEVKIHGIATQLRLQPVILDANVPYHLHDSWLFTLGSHYRISPKWVLRVAGSYNQSPGNSRFQITNGDSVIVGASVGYELSKNIVVDGSYAHAFILHEDIHANFLNNQITGQTKGFVDVVSLKLTFNL